MLRGCCSSTMCQGHLRSSWLRGLQAVMLPYWPCATSVHCHDAHAEAGQWNGPTRGRRRERAHPCCVSPKWFINTLYTTSYYSILSLASYKDLSKWKTWKWIIYLENSHIYNKSIKQPDLFVIYLRMLSFGFHMGGAEVRLLYLPERPIKLRNLRLEILLNTMF